MQKGHSYFALKAKYLDEVRYANYLEGEVKLNAWGLPWHHCGDLDI